MSKPVDLKCEETLRDTPSPPPDLIYPTTTASLPAVVSNSTISVEPPTGSTFNIFVRRFDPQTAEPYQRNSPSSSSGRSDPANPPQTIKATKLESPKPQSAYISQFFPNSNVLYTPVTKLLQHNPQIFPPIFPSGSYPLEQSYQPLIKNVSPVKLPCTEMPEHSSISTGLFRESAPMLAAGGKQSTLPKVISLPAVIPRPQQQKQSQMSVVDTQGSSSARPVTLHINTGKGTAVVQLQQSAAISPSSTKQMSITSKRSTLSDQPQQVLSPTVNAGRPTSMVAAPSSVISSVPTYSSRIFPSPISLPPTALAAGAYIYQDHMTAFQTLASMQNMNAKLIPSSVTMHQPTSLPFIVGAGGTSRPFTTNIHDPHFLTHTRLGISPMKPLSSPAGFHGSSPTTPASASQNVQGNNGSSTVAGTPGQSPRPSILRKRPSEISSISSVSKKLTYDSLATTPRKLTDVPSSLAVDEVVISTTRGPEHPDASNSNHSSSASTVSAGSALDGHSNSSYPDNGTNRSLSPSPRKRPRKQNLDDLPEGGGGGELDSEDGRLSTETLVADQQGEFSENKPNTAGLSSKSDFMEPLMKLKSVKIEMNDDECTKVPRRPRPSLWSSCETTWQPRRNHFLHYDDVKAKEEKKPSAADICNNKQIWQKIEGWRLHMIAMHVDDLEKCEQTNLDDLDLILRTFDVPKADDGVDHADLDFMKEMVMTSVQRCKAVKEQLSELKKPLYGILKHKRNVETLVQKYSAKRPLRKKEKTDL